MACLPRHVVEHAALQRLILAAVPPAHIAMALLDKALGREQAQVAADRLAGDVECLGQLRYRQKLVPPQGPP